MAEKEELQGADELTPDAKGALPVCGLTSAEVAERVAEGKVNGEQTVRTKSVAQILRSNILTFFNFVFILLAVLLAGFVPAGMDGIGNFGFLILIVFNTLVGIVQELRAKRTMDKLSLLSAPKAFVIRDGEEKEIAIEDIVLDDITELAAGRYYIKESAAPKGYALDEKIYTADVTSGNTAVVNVKDVPQSASVNILLEKTDAQTGEKSPEGTASFADAEFTVRYYAGYYDQDPALKGAKAERTWVMRTDSSGQIMLQDAQKVSGDAFYRNSAGKLLQI